VLQTTTTSDVTPPTVTTETPVAGASGVALGSGITVTFNEAMDSTTVSANTIILTDSLGNQIEAVVTYDAFTATAVLYPVDLLSYSTLYTVKVKGGSTGVKDTTGNALAADLSWTFNTAAPVLPANPEGPGGPILVIASSSNPFTRYYAEILRAEGFNSFYMMDISDVLSSTLANYDVVVLGEMALTSAQISMLTDWVNGGGHLIAMKPDNGLAPLLGLTDTGSGLADGYLLVNTAAAPGAGIVNQSIQFHGIADRYALNGATAVATLYSNATTATTNPAVTIRGVGSNNGQAAAFTYDLAKSIVYTRQGNPAWSGQERDGVTPIRSDDLFYPDWINLSKVAIPQADEQQRLLANMIIHMNMAKKPLPRFWYFPRGLPAVVVMTGDNHGASQYVSARFDTYANRSPVGCSVTNWECVRATAYIFNDGDLTPAQATAYEAAGFEIAPHMNTNCQNYTADSLQAFYTNQISSWSMLYPSLAAPVTNRTHCVVWSDYSTQPQIELSHGIGLDTNYYYYPGTWVNNRPGFFTGSGIPMRFATPSGALIDVYQVPTQMTDESEQTYPLTVNTLLDRAIGTEGYYGAFAANIHSDSEDSTVSDLIVASAQARGIPVISAKQLLQWLDGRSGSAFGDILWDGSSLSFTVSAGQNTNGLTALVPVSNGASVSSVTLNNASLPYSIATIKGVQYVLFYANAGTFRIVLTSDATPPTIASVSPSSGTSGVGSNTRVTAVFSEAIDSSTITATTFELLTPAQSVVPAAVTYDEATKTATLVPSSALTSLTTYTVTVLGGSTGVKDLAGNALASTFTSTFTTGAATSAQYSVWSSTTTPATISVADPNAVELGMRFRSDVSGYITGVRFYKSTQNTGTHTGSLWSNTGTLLGTVTFTNETSSGWQQASFSSPIPISANTTYVVSYHAAVGYYSANANYFTSSIDNSPLHALANGVDGANGVYKYGSTGFPTQTYASANYWVDVVFQP
jgi:hypothetical protein